MLTIPSLSPERDSVVTATDSTILMGAVPDEWGTPMDVWKSKMGIKSTRRSTPITLLGHILEPLIIQHTMDQPDYNNFAMEYVGFQRHSTLPLGCTPDAMLTNALGTTRFGLECKSTVYSKDWGDEEIPYRVSVQINHSMLVKDSDRWDVAAYLMTPGGREALIARFMEKGALTMDDAIEHGEFIHYARYRDAKLCAKIEEVAMDFWENYVLTKRPPEEFSVPSEQIRSEPIPPTVVTMDNYPETHAILNRYRAAKEASDVMESELKEASDLLRGVLMAMGTPIQFVGSDGVVFNSKLTHVNGRKSVDYEKVIDEIVQTTGFDRDLLKILISSHTNVGMPSARLDFKENKTKKGKA